MAGDTPKPLIAFREWGMEDGRLAPRFQHAARGTNPWSRPRGTVTAICKRYDSLWSDSPKEHHAAAAGCSCGLYGYYDIPERYQAPILSHSGDQVDTGGITFQQADAMARALESMGVKPKRVQALADAYPTDTVFGAYVGFGEVTKHRKGFRSQKARVVALRWSPVAEEIAALYEIAVCDTPAELKAAAMKWGELVDPETLPSSSRGGGFPTQGQFKRQWKGGLSSAYRSPNPAMANPLAQMLSYHYVSSAALTPRVRAAAKLRLMRGVEVIWKTDAVTGSQSIKVKGLDKAWTIRAITQHAHPVELPYPGSTKMGMRVGTASYELEVEGCFDRSELKAALDSLRKIGQWTQVSESPIV